jgi:hypothetical protein
MNDTRARLAPLLYFPAVVFLLLRAMSVPGALSGTLARAAEPPPAKELMGLPLLFTEEFESGSAGRWEPSDPKAWRIEKQGENTVYNQFKASDTNPSVRSPFNRSLIKDIVVGDFVLEARVRSTARDYGHRDVCLFFGFQDASHLYYVHLGKRADPHANSIFVVDNEPRVSIAKMRTDGTPWDDNWHRVRVVRKVATGAIEVYFDDMAKPVMTAEDKRFASGRVGVGTFDDTGMFDEVRLWGTKVKSRE